MIFALMKSHVQIQHAARDTEISAKFSISMENANFQHVPMQTEKKREVLK